MSGDMRNTKVDPTQTLCLRNSHTSLESGKRIQLSAPLLFIYLFIFCKLPKSTCAQQRETERWREIGRARKHPQRDMLTPQSLLYSVRILRHAHKLISFSSCQGQNWNCVVSHIGSSSLITRPQGQPLDFLKFNLFISSMNKTDRKRERDRETAP